MNIPTFPPLFLHKNGKRIQGDYRGMFTTNRGETMVWKFGNVEVWEILLKDYVRLIKGEFKMLRSCKVPKDKWNISLGKCRNKDLDFPF
jgi:hypothetical protein